MCGSALERFLEYYFRGKTDGIREDQVRERLCRDMGKGMDEILTCQMPKKSVLLPFDPWNHLRLEPRVRSLQVKGTGHLQPSLSIGCGEECMKLQLVERQGFPSNLLL